MKTTLETTSERLDHVKAYVQNRRDHAKECLNRAREPHWSKECLDGFRDEAEVADAVASGVESAIRILFDEAGR